MTRRDRSRPPRTRGCRISAADREYLKGFEFGLDLGWQEGRRAERLDWQAKVRAVAEYADEVGQRAEVGQDRAAIAEDVVDLTDEEIETFASIVIEERARELRGDRDSA